MSIKHECGTCNFFFDNQCYCNDSSEFLYSKHVNSNPCDEFEMFEEEV